VTTVISAVKVTGVPATSTELQLQITRKESKNVSSNNINVYQKDKLCYGSFMVVVDEIVM